MPSVGSGTNNKKSLGVAERGCIALDSLCRLVLRFEAPGNVADSAFRDAYFEQEVKRGHMFWSGFATEPFLHDRTVLEIGCGYGGMLLALLEKGAQSAIGIDVNRERVNYAEKRLAHEPRCRVMVDDVQETVLPSASVDIAVTDAVLEHISDISIALAQVFRVLRPGGSLYAKFSPTWLTYNGPHLITYISIPWVHLLFSDRTIVNVLYHYRESGRFPEQSVTERIEDFQRMGRLTRRKFTGAASACGFKIVQEKSQSPRAWKAAAARIPILDELLAGQIVAILEKPGLTGEEAGSEAFGT
jgi:ubiquinone/menaquinone biosynthesis C-methylase UbiE